MTNEEAKARIKDFVDTYELEYRETAMMIKPKDYEAFKLAIKALEQQPCEDAVSRAEAIDKLTKFYNMVLDDNGTKLNIRDIVGTLERLPSVTPERPKGKWIPAPMKVYGYPLNCMCSKCGKKVINTDNFCPKCGSYNGGGEE